MRLHRIFAALVLIGTLGGSGSAARAAVLVSIDKTTQRMTVVADGELLWVWPVSTGRAGYDTPNGRYTAFRLEEDHYSREWDDAPMPHSIFFTRIGHAIHGTDQTVKLGQPASHGCVRLAREHAAMLFALVREHGVLNTSVVVDGVLPPPPPPPVARRKLPVPAVDFTGSARSREVAPAEPLAAHRVPGPPPRPRPALPVEPPPAPPQRAARAYVPAPPARPAPAERPTYEPRRSYAPGVIYDPRVEIIEETYVNGHWVRRRYYRQARPQDFQRWR